MSEEQTTNEKKCKCKILIGLTILSLLMSSVALGLSIMNHATLNATGVKKVVISKQYDKGKSLEKARETKKPIVVFFYTDWCGYCQRFAPTFNKITKTRAFKKDFAVAYVNCEKPENSTLMQEFNVTGFPTVYVIDKEGNKHQLDNQNFFGDDAEKLVKENINELVK